MKKLLLTFCILNLLPNYTIINASQQSKMLGYKRIQGKYDARNGNKPTTITFTEVIAAQKHAHNSIDADNRNKVGYKKTTETSIQTFAQEQKRKQQEAQWQARAREKEKKEAQQAATEFKARLATALAAEQNRK